MRNSNADRILIPNKPSLPEVALCDGDFITATDRTVRWGGAERREEQPRRQSGAAMHHLLCLLQHGKPSALG